MIHCGDTIVMRCMHTQLGSSHHKDEKKEIEYDKMIK